MDNTIFKGLLENTEIEVSENEIYLESNFKGFYLKCYVEDGNENIVIDFLGFNGYDDESIALTGKQKSKLKDFMFSYEEDSEEATGGFTSDDYMHFEKLIHF